MLQGWLQSVLPVRLSGCPPQPCCAVEATLGPTTCYCVYVLQVRLLVAAAGLELLQLKRVRVGGFVMPAGLKPGQYM